MASELDNNLVDRSSFDAQSPSPANRAASSSQAHSGVVSLTSFSTTGANATEPHLEPATLGLATTTAQDRDYQALFDGIRKDRPKCRIWLFFLRSIGLRCFTPKRSYRTPARKEKKKVLMYKSRLVALARLGIHILPSVITILLIALNGVSFVNGPDVSTLSKYFLQGAAKIHELAIVGSLAAVVLDVLRHKVLSDGVNLGLLSSPYSFMGLNFLWSQDFFSAVRYPFPLRSKVPFLLLLTLCCGLAAIVGPASALLFLPSQAWVSTGSSEFYFVGNQTQLWPQHLSVDSLGSDVCKGSHPQSMFYCLHGGWNVMRSFITSEGTSRKTTFMGDGARPRNLFLTRPYSGSRTGTDSWASTTHMATAYLAYDLDAAHDRAWTYAKGRQRRLRDAIEGYLIRVKGRIPVVRTVCGPFADLTLAPIKLQFPVLDQNQYWRRDDQVGLLKDLDVGGIYVLDSRVNATWVSLSQEFGTTTAGLTYITRNETGTTVGCGCTIDARWAEGESNTHGKIGARTWQAMIGQQRLPAGIGYAEIEGKQFFEKGMKENLGNTITADIDMLRGLTPPGGTENNSLTMDQNAGIGLGNFSTLEQLLLNTRLWDIAWILGDHVQPTMEMEAVISAYFVNALSRVGWYMQADTSFTKTNRILRMGSVDNDNLLHKDGKNWERPTNISTSSLEEEWFSYTTAWQLNDPVLYISVTVLALHLVIAIAHSLWVVFISKGRTSEAWDSITELIALAYNSNPRGDVMQNCGVGIMLRETLSQKMKVVSVEEGQDGREEKVQLVPCDEQLIADRNALLRQEKMSAVEIGKEYG